MKEVEKKFDFASLDLIDEFKDSIGLDDAEFQKALLFYSEDLLYLRTSKVCCYDYR